MTFSALDPPPPRLRRLIGRLALCCLSWAIGAAAEAPAGAMPLAPLNQWRDGPADVAPTLVRGGHGGGHRGGGMHSGMHGRPGGMHPGHPGVRPPGGHPGHGRPGYGRPGYGHPPHRPGYGGWHRPYRWAPGGAIAAGAAIGFVGAATAAAYASAPPQPGLCWYYTDQSRRNGFWDVCP